MNRYIILLLLILSISICEMIGQSCLKYYKKNDTKSHFCLYAIVFYIVVCYLLLKTYDYEGMGLVNVLWSGISILVILFAGYMFFDETVTWMDKLGVVFVILGIGFISYENN